MFSKKQNEYIRNSNKRWNIKTGATQSGKTYLDYYYTIPARIRERAGKDGLNFILGVSKSTIERNILEPMRNIYGSILVGYINNQNIARMFGEDVYCLGAEKVSQVSKLRGASVKYCYGDEIADWNSEVFQMLKSRLSKPYSCFDGALNPQSPTHWLKSFIDSDADIYLQQYTIFDNPYLSKEYVDNLCKEYLGTIYYERYIKGNWVMAEGTIYKKFADNPRNYVCKIVDKIDSNCSAKQILKRDILEITIGIDFGGNKSGHAFVASAKTRGYKELIALESELHYGDDIDSNKLDSLAVAFVQRIFDKYGRVDFCYYDSAETVLGRGIKNAIESKFKSVIVRYARKIKVNDRISCLIRLIGADRMFISESIFNQTKKNAKDSTLKDALSDAVYDSKSTEDKRLDDFTSNIDLLDAYEYSWERDIKSFLDYK